MCLNTFGYFGDCTSWNRLMEDLERMLVAPFWWTYLGIFFWEPQMQYVYWYGFMHMMWGINRWVLNSFCSISPVQCFLSLKSINCCMTVLVQDVPILLWWALKDNFLCSGIFQNSLQLSCGDICQIWMWFNESNRYFARSKKMLTEKLTSGAVVTHNLERVVRHRATSPTTTNLARVYFSC